MAAAQAELDRASELASTLTLTQQFLKEAQQRVHLDIAPVLANTLKQHLPPGDRRSVRRRGREPGNAARCR